MTEALHIALMNLERKVVDRRLRGEPVGDVEMQFVLCEDQRTVMVYAHVNESEADLASFLLPAGVAFDPAAYAEIIGAQSRTIH